MNNWEKYSEEELYSIYQNSKSLSDFAKTIGINRNLIPTIRKKYSWLVDKRKTYNIGQKYGNLTILEKISGKQVKCQCDCGNIITVYISNLASGYTKSCGCLRQEKSKQHVIEINQKRSEQHLNGIIGQTYGYLTVIEKDLEESQKNNRTYVKCKCNCGCNSIISVRVDSLKDGNTTSCGSIKSRGELKIKTILNDLKINYKQQVHFQDLKNKGYLYFDFGIYDSNNNLLFLIEFQGSQHYNISEHWGGQEALKMNQLRDQLKRDYCFKNNIKLIEIPYWELKNINEEYLRRLMI